MGLAVLWVCATGDGAQVAGELPGHQGRCVAAKGSCCA